MRADLPRPGPGDLPQQVGQVFTLDRRLTLTGRVRTPSGEAVPSAHVVAMPFTDAYVHHSCLDNPGMASLAPLANSGDAMTTADGSYRMDLDPGLYRVFVDPGTSSGFAPTLGPPLCLTGNASDHVITVDAPVEVHGVVRDAAGGTLPGATIEALIRIRETGAPGVLVHAARRTAGAGGSYTLSLPSGATLGL